MGGWLWTVFPGNVFVLGVPRVSSPAGTPLQFALAEGMEASVRVSSVRHHLPAHSHPFALGLGLLPPLTDVFGVSTTLPLIQKLRFKF